MKKFGLVALFLAGVCPAALAIDVIIPGTKRIGDVPGGDGTGLCGDYWAIGGFGTNVDAYAYANGNAPDGVFVSTLVDYANGVPDTSPGAATVLEHLGIDGPSLTPGSVGSNLVASSLWRFRGGLAVRAEYDVDPVTPGIQVFFSLGSQDGSGFFIDDIEVINNEGSHPYAYVDQRVSFELPGLYPVDLIYYANGGETGIEWYSTIPGGPDYGAPAPGMGIVPTENLYDCTVPEPGTLLLLSAGVAAIVARRRCAALR
ncbi:MAG TPA: PEP-CTERM sorting domain-containing protein [Fimbriimonadaceae bacterium]|nr:PEP-CTERM sorting domain-containing protein [Fimbriimonadaceae bacterium]HRJ97396.1 PEP-CTERM sorting domain-containing protein [Fimbriimonadaceae bacterium]